MPKVMECKVGSYTGTGAALTSGINSIGFKPQLVLAFNQTDGDSCWFHVNGMTDDTACAIGAAAAQVASGGCTLSSTGFSLGSSAVINESGKTFLYIAIGGN